MNKPRNMDRSWRAGLRERPVPENHAALTQPRSPVHKRKNELTLLIWFGGDS